MTNNDIEAFWNGVTDVNVYPADVTIDGGGIYNKIRCTCPKYMTNDLTGSNPPCKCSDGSFRDMNNLPEDSGARYLGPPQPADTSTGDFIIVGGPDANMGAGIVPIVGSFDPTTGQPIVTHGTPTGTTGTGTGTGTGVAGFDVQTFIHNNKQLLLLAAAGLGLYLFTKD